MKGSCEYHEYPGTADLDAMRKDGRKRSVLSYPCPRCRICSSWTCSNRKIDDWKPVLKSRIFDFIGTCLPPDDTVQRQLSRKSRMYSQRPDISVSTCRKIHRNHCQEIPSLRHWYVELRVVGKPVNSSLTCSNRGIGFSYGFLRPSE